jgi:hypothetical protein
MYCEFDGGGGRGPSMFEETFLDMRIQIKSEEKNDF